MARPTKKYQDKLNKNLPSVRCTEADLKTIRQKADDAEKSVSEYMRHMALHGKVNVQKRNVDFELLQELKRSGNNLNQLTKIYHSKRAEPIDQLKQVLETHHKLLEKIFNNL